LADSVSNAFQLLSKSGLEDEAKEAFGKILNIQTFDTKSIRKAFYKLSEEGKQQAEANLLRQAATLKDSSDRLQSFKGAAEAGKKAYDEFIQSTANTNPLFKIGTSLQSLAVEMQNLKTNGVNELGAAFDLFAKKPEFAALFGKNFVDNLIVVRQEFIKNRDALQQADTQLKQATVDARKYKEETQNIDTSRFLATGGAARRRVNERSDVSSANLQAAQERQQMAEVTRNAAVSLNEASVKKGSDLLNSGITGAFKESARIIDVALGQSAAKAALTIAKTRAAGLYGVERARVEGNLAKKELEVQLKAVDLNIDMILSQERLIFALQASQAATNAQAQATKVQTLQLKATELQDKAKTLPEGSPEKVTAQKNIDLANKAVTDAEASQRNLQAVSEGLGAVSRSLDQATRSTMGKGGKGVGLSKAQLDALSSDEARSQARLAIMPVQNKISAQVASGIEIKGAITAREEQTSMNVRAAQVEQSKTLLSLENSIGASRENNLNLTTSIAGTTSREIINQQEAQALESLRGQQRLARLDKEARLAEALINIQKKQGGQESANEIRRELSAMSQKDTQDEINLLLDFRNKRTNNEITLIEKELELKKEQAQVDSERDKFSLEYQTAQLANYSELYGFSKKFNIEQQALLDKKRVELEYTDKTKTATLEIEAKRAAAQEKIKSIMGNADEVDGLSVEQIATINAIKTQLTQEDELYNKQKTRADQQKNSQLKILDLTKTVALEQAKYNELLENASAIAAGLQNVFGDLGESLSRIGTGLGEMATAVTNFAINSEKGAKALGELAKKEKAAADAGNEEDRAKFSKEYALQEKKNRKDEISGYAAMAGAAKKMFNERSKGYKALGAVEKALHIARLAMDAKELAVKLANIGTELAVKIESAMGWLMFKLGVTVDETAMEHMGFMARMGTYISEIYLKVTSQMGIFGPAIATALIAGLGIAAAGRGRGSSAKPPPTAEERANVSGTAMGYTNQANEGNAAAQGNTVVQYREGVLGEAKSRSQVFTQTLDIIENYVDKNLLVAGKMLGALYAIKSGIADFVGAAKQLFTRKISPFGTEEGYNSSYVLGIFGGSERTTINAQGLKLASPETTFRQLMTSAEDYVNYFQDVTEETTMRIIFSFRDTDRIFTEAALSALGSEGDPQTRRLAERMGVSLRQIFTGSFSMLSSIAEDIGVSPEYINQLADAGLGVLAESIGTLDLKDVDPSEYAERLQGWSAGVFEIAFKPVLDDFKRFATDASEDLAAVAFRVNANFKAANTLIRNIGGEDIRQYISRTQPQLAGTARAQAGFTISEELIGAFGGPENYVDMMSSYADAYLTDSQKFINAQRFVSDSFTALQISGITTAEQFNSLVLETQRAAMGTGPAADAAQELLVGLVSLGPTFMETTRQVEEALKELKTETKDILQDILKVGMGSRYGITSYEGSLMDINKDFQERLDKLKEEGLLTRENVQALDELRDARLQLLDAENKFKATQIVDDLQSQLMDTGLSSFGKELVSITRKSQDYVRSLNDIGHATDENVALVAQLETVLIDKARESARAAQAQTYNQLFGTTTVAITDLARKFGNLGVRVLPKNIKELQALTDTFSGTTDQSLELRGSILAVGQEFKTLFDQLSSNIKTAYDSRVQELKSARDQFKGFADSIKQFKTSLLTGNLSPITPAGQYQLLREEFLQTSSLAKTGDVAAIQKLQDITSKFLESSRGMFASSDQYVSDFSLATQTLDDTQTLTEIQVQLAENTLTEIKNAVDALLGVNNAITASTETTTTVLFGIGDKLGTAIADYTTAFVDQVSASISEDNGAVAQVRTEAFNVANAVANLFDKSGNIVTGIGATTSAVDLAKKAVDDLKTDLNNKFDAAYQQADRIAGEEAAYRDRQQQQQQQQQAGLERPFTGTTNPLAPANTPSSGTFDPRFFAPMALTSSMNSVGESEYNQTGGALISGDMYWAGDSWEKLPSRAMGSNFVPQDMAAYIHKGERIMPAADNRKLMEYLDQPQQTNSELQEEVRRLTKQVETLTQVVAEGAIANARATAENTAEITNAIKQTGDAAVYNQKIQSRTSIA
jgi:hypothetical protein